MPGASDEDDIYANSYWFLYKTLSVLAEEPSEQCETMNYDHVAWQIRWDATSWTHPVLDLPGAGLSDEQRQAIGRLLSEVAAVPDSVVMVPNVKEEHLRTMGDPCWIPIRAHAKALIPLLENETQRTHDILWPKDDQNVD